MAGRHRLEDREIGLGRRRIPVIPGRTYRLTASDLENVQPVSRLRIPGYLPKLVLTA